MAAELVIDVVGNATDAANALDSVGDAADRMADQVADASRRAESAASGIDRTASAADNLDDKAGRATGALGALASGFELAGATEFAAGLQAAGMATDFLSGVGQTLTLVTEAGRLAQIRHTAATKARRVAELASAAATRTMAVAQRVLNAAMRANPLGLVITAVLAIGAALVLAYKRSQTFRNIVDSAMRAARTAVGWVVDKVDDLVGWVRDKVPAGVNKMKSAATSAFNAVKTPVQAVIDKVESVATTLKNKLEGAFSDAKRIGKDAFDTVKTAVDNFLRPIEDAIGAVGDLINKIKDIDFPKVPDLNPFNGRVGVDWTAPGRTVGAGGGDTYQITVNGALDADAVARQIETVIDRRRRRIGRPVVFGPA